MPDLQLSDGLLGRVQHLALHLVVATIPKNTNHVHVRVRRSFCFFEKICQMSVFRLQGLTGKLSCRLPRQEKLRNINVVIKKIV